MARQWLISWPTAGSLLVHCISNVKGRASAVFLPQTEQLQARGGMETASSPRCGAWPCACTLFLHWEELAGSRGAGLPLAGQTVCLCVQRSSAWVARHLQSGRLTQQPVCASTARFIMSTWSESVMSMGHKYDVLAITIKIHSTSPMLCLGTLALC